MPIDSVLPSGLVSFASGALPPPDRVRELSEALADRVPSPFALSVLSTATQLPPCWTRVGVGVLSWVSVPSGLAVVCAYGVVSAPTTTGCPLACAWATARASGVASAGSPVTWPSTGSVPLSAAAGPASPAVAAPASVSASASRTPTARLPCLSRRRFTRVDLLMPPSGSLPCGALWRCGAAQ